MTLYEIDNQLSALIEDEGRIINAETGELLSASVLDELTLERDAKIENIALYIKNLTAEADALKAEKKRLEERAKAKESKAAWLTGYLEKSLAGETFESVRVAISYGRASDSVQYTGNIADLADRFIRRKEMLEVDKTALKEALKAGTVIPGASIVTSRKLKIK